jgi:hypothetical protein
MEENSSDNIFQNLKGLIWSAFIGIVSFQILAPNIWGYLHRLLGIRYGAAYWGFIIVYLLLVPVLSVTWLLKDYRSIIRYLPPVDDPATADRKYRTFVNGLILYISLESAISLLLLCPGIPNYTFFEIWAGLNGLFCLALLVCGASLTYHSLVKGVDGGQGNVFRRNYWQLIAVCFIAYIFLAFVGITYLKNNEYKSLFRPDDPGSGREGFGLLALKEKIDSTERHLHDLADSLRVLNIGDSLSKIVTKEEKTNAQDSSKIADSLQKAKDTLNGLLKAYVVYGNETMSLLDSIKKDKRVVSIDSNTVHWNPRNLLFFQYDKSVEGISRRGADLPVTQPLGPKRETDALLSEFTGKLFLYVCSLEKQIDNTARERLGKQLRDTQTKGMFLLMGLFIALLALHIFLKINERTLRRSLDNIREEKRLLLAYRSRLTDDSAVERTLIGMEKRVAESGGLTANSWLYITLVVWLLIPFFKPVEDDKIDTDAPFKMLTASGASGGLWDGGKQPGKPVNNFNTFYRDTAANYFVHVDSVVVSKGKTENFNFPPDLQVRLIRLTDSVRTVDSIMRSIKRKIDHIEPDKKTTKP